MTHKPFSQACENNKTPILDILQKELPQNTFVLEIGSGTGQHAAFFSEMLPKVIWQPSDRYEYLSGIRLWLTGSGNKNCLPVIELDVLQDNWPKRFDHVFTANTLHIMPWNAVEITFKKLGELLPQYGKFIVYGPFNHDGKYTSDGNAQFDSWLKSIAPHQGIRNFESVNILAQKNGFKCVKDYSMPANNQIIVWQKNSGASDSSVVP